MLDKNETLSYDLRGMKITFKVNVKKTFKQKKTNHSCLSTLSILSSLTLSAPKTESGLAYNGV